MGEGYGEEGDSCAGDVGGVSASRRDVDGGIGGVQSQSCCLGVGGVGRRVVGGGCGGCSTRVWLGRLLLAGQGGDNTALPPATRVSPSARRRVRVSSLSAPRRACSPLLSEGRKGEGGSYLQKLCFPPPRPPTKPPKPRAIVPGDAL